MGSTRRHGRHRFTSCTILASRRFLEETKTNRRAHRCKQPRLAFELVLICRRQQRESRVNSSNKAAFELREIVERRWEPRIVLPACVFSRSDTVCSLSGRSNEMFYNLRSTVYLQYRAFFLFLFLFFF